MEWYGWFMIGFVFGMITFQSRLRHFIVKLVTTGLEKLDHTLNKADEK